MTITVTGLTELAARLAAVRFLARTATISTPLDYAVFVQDGTRAHDILPRNKRALYWPGAAHPVTAVRHPGTKANPFLTDALAARENELVTGIATAIGAVVDGSAALTAYDDAFKKGAEAVADDARGRIHSVTGDLAKSVTVEIGQ